MKSSHNFQCRFRHGSKKRHWVCKFSGDLSERIGQIWEIEYFQDPQHFYENGKTLDFGLPVQIG